MRKLILFIFICSLSLLPYQKTQAMDAKGKAFLIICTYGTVGGALLGFASMAFGTNSRAIAQGASLGLYAGIAFGSYVLISHKRSLEGPQDPMYDPQQPPPPGYGPEGFGEPLPPEGGGFGYPPPQEDSNAGSGFFGQRAYEINDDLLYNYRLDNKKGRELSLPIYVPIFHSTF
ncbi:MAG: hypothetical protein QF441_01350 [Bacteriovoracaceae bacterium]|mgnify:CR=1 FL=1|jgi:hypothetical protein|nr:hypothetical protein [Halobacteriovoraceae bacterium]MDP7319217.1 hypothetical protein [Bacteriovoracaceae bacterium]